MKIKRIFDVFFGQGLYTFSYLVKNNLQEKESEENKYKAHKKAYDKLEKIRYGNAKPRLGIIIWQNSGKEDASRLKNSVQSIESQPENIEYVIVGKEDELKEKIEELSWDYIGFMTAGDILCRNYAVSVLNTIYFEKRKSIDVKLLYYDYEVVKQENNKENYFPEFLPDYSPDYLLNRDYIGENFLISRELLTSVMDKTYGKSRLYTYQILLKCISGVKDNEVCHIQSVLRKVTNSYFFSKEKKEIIRDLKRNILLEKNKEIKEIIFFDNSPLKDTHICYVPQHMPKVSIIIPSKDNPKLVSKCLESIYKYTGFTPYQIVLVDNGSSDENKKSYESIFAGYDDVEIKYIYEKMDFNFSRMCNIGADNSDGEYLLFLNDDIEVIKPQFETTENIDWLGVMAGQAMQSHTGAVGAKLYFPDTKIIQHTGIINYESGAAHIHSREEENSVATNHCDVDRNYLALTGACLMVSRDKFNKVNGFSEELAVTFNDVDLCMKLYECGLHNIVRKDVVLYHHESITRGEDALDLEKFRRHLQEREKLFDMHKELVKRDPYYSPYLNQNRLDGSLNSHYYYNQPAKACNMESLKRITQMDYSAKIHSVILRDNLLHVRGYGFKHGEKVNSLYRPYIYIKYKGKEFMFNTIRLYEPTLGTYLNIEQNVNFASFYVCIDTWEIDNDFDASVCDIKIALSDGKKSVFVTHEGEKIL